MKIDVRLATYFIEILLVPCDVRLPCVGKYQYCVFVKDVALLLEVIVDQVVVLFTKMRINENK